MSEEKKVGVIGWFGLIVWIAIVAAAAAFGSQFGAGEWYDNLHKPAWNPPDWVFGPVWSILYLMMAVSAWLVWLRRKDQRVYPALAVFIVQLVLNGAWSWLFFGEHQMGLAFAELLILDLMILVTIVLVWRIRVIAAVLLVPYLAWVSFAGFLNYTLWQMNP